MQHVFIVGSKSMGAYGGYETFVNKLTEYHQNNEKIKYHVACKANGDGSMDESKLDGAVRISNTEFEYHNAHCFKIQVPDIGRPLRFITMLQHLTTVANTSRKISLRSPLCMFLPAELDPLWHISKRKYTSLAARCTSIRMGTNGREQNGLRPFVNTGKCLKR